MLNPANRVPSHIVSQLLREAQRATRRQTEAEDLFQTVWLAAVETGREDLTSAANRRWFVGALRKRGMFDARTAVRRRTREERANLTHGYAGERTEVPVRFVEQLPPKLRTTALLALTGHSKTEILWLLRLNEPALRQRIADIRRRWRADDGVALGEISALGGPLHFGRIRQALLPVARGSGVLLASHDPDGHLFVVGDLTKASSAATG